MTSLSDRQHDAFDNPAKAACREGNLRVLREAACQCCRRTRKINRRLDSTARKVRARKRHANAYRGKYAG